MEKIILEKKIQDNSNGNELASIVKELEKSLKKNNVNAEDYISRVALCIDLSGSMAHLLKSGKVSEIIKRALAQGILFNNNREIDIFGFGETAKYFGKINENKLEEFSESFKSKKTLGGTKYSKAISMISNHYSKEGFDLPVYVLFITDGDSTDKIEAKKEIEKTSLKPIFFQFIGIGGLDYKPQDENSLNIISKILFGKKILMNRKEGAKKRFKFLMEVSEKEEINNIGFFAISDPLSIKPKKLFELINFNYPGWYKKAKENKMF